jgi:hypothetical protein
MIYELMRLSVDVGVSHEKCRTMDGLEIVHTAICAKRDQVMDKLLALPDPTTGFAPVVTEEIEPALYALANYQQTDMEGVMVTVSRQAIDEVLEWVRALPHAKTEEEVEEALLERLCALLKDHDSEYAEWLHTLKGESDG